VTGDDRLLELLQDAKRLAREYRELTGRPLGITAEVAELEAARILDVKLAEVRQAGYDATRPKAGAPGAEEKLQIKGRCVLPDQARSQQIGRIKLAGEWDAVLLVLLDEQLEATAIWEADRASVETALTTPGSRARNERGALSVAKFRQIGRRVWQGT
jgi:hypothetical protein